MECHKKLNMECLLTKIGILILNFLEKYWSSICLIGNKRYVIKLMSMQDLISYTKITLHSNEFDLYAPKEWYPYGKDIV